MENIFTYIQKYHTSSGETMYVLKDTNGTIRELTGKGLKAFMDNGLIKITNLEISPNGRIVAKKVQKVKEPTINKGLTIEELERFCKKEIAKGNGKKHIWISNDDEGNGYHRLFYAFTSGASDVKNLLEYGSYLDKQEKLNEIVILG